MTLLGRLILYVPSLRGNLLPSLHLLTIVHASRDKAQEIPSGGEVFAEPLAGPVMRKVAEDAGLCHPLLSGIARERSGKAGALLEVRRGPGGPLPRMIQEEAYR